MLFVRDGQIHRAKVTPVRPASDVDRGEKPFIKAWGEQTGPKWSPDGRKIAFVSLRTDHSFVVVYDMATRTVKYMSPSVDFDSSPMWSGDGKSVVYSMGGSLWLQAQQAARHRAGGGVSAKSGRAGNGRRRLRTRRRGAVAGSKPPPVALKERAAGPKRSLEDVQV